MADILTAHIEACPDHPMSALKAEVARLTAETLVCICTGCDSTKAQCVAWQREGRIACCPDCKHVAPSSAPREPQKDETPRKYRLENSATLHLLWTRAVGTVDYVKADWTNLRDAISRLEDALEKKREVPREPHAPLLVEIDKALEHCARSYAMERSYQCLNCALLRRCRAALLSRVDPPGSRTET